METIDVNTEKPNVCWRIELTGNRFDLEDLVVSLSFRDELSHFSDRLAFSMEVIVPSRRSVWTGKRCIVRTVGVSITETL